ncbi:MAG: toll/interleukin-1 receptor domain-containing protein [Sphingomonas phyllosphaerae]
MTERYAAFISYSHADGAAARWLHRRLETFRMPRALVGTPSSVGPVQRKLLPSFRDRDELAASGDLGTELRAALAASRFQIVLCSPRAAQSRWVNEEILSFKRLHGEHRTLALIVSGEPYAGDERECFPPALRFQLGADQNLSTIPAEPIAADIRPGKDGRRLAALKLIAGVAGVPLDALVRRDAARRQRRLMWITAASLVVAAVTVGLAIYAEGQRRVAVRQRELADKSLDFLIGTFQIANPATENPRTITALTILDRASHRAASELADEPGVSARLLRATGEIYVNLGVVAEAERDLKLALARLPPRGEERARTWLMMARVKQKQSDLAASERAIAAALASYDARSPDAPGIDAEVAERQGRAAILAARYDRAADLYAEAARRYAALEGDHRADVGRAQLNQAESLLRLGRLAEAQQIYARATRAYVGRFGLNHVLTADAIRNQALAALEGGKLDAAQRQVDEALAIYNRVLEPRNPTIGRALLLRGRILARAGKLDEAAASFEKARALYAAVYGANSVDVADTEFFAADAEAAAGKFRDALARTVRIKAIYDREYGPDDPDQAELLELRARILRAAGRAPEAVAACRSAQALRKRIHAEARSDTTTRPTCI